MAGIGADERNSDTRSEDELVRGAGMCGRNTRRCKERLTHRGDGRMLLTVRSLEENLVFGWL